MTKEARTEWLIAAYMAIQHLPADLLERGARAAMRTADHPSKIVPAIIAEVSGSYESRKRHGPAISKAIVPQIEAPIEPPCPPAEAEKIMTEYGMKEETKAMLRRHLGPPRNPTDAETAEIMKEMGL